jgi:diguanylate cyclase (GGDEF)-like protein
MLARARRRHGEPALLYLDLDGFKYVNDTFGHSAGDKLLQSVAARLEGVVRDGDTVGRLGGDEFVVLLDSPGAGVDPELVALRLLEVLRQPVDLDGASDRTLKVTASLGLAVGLRASAEELLRDADIALYAAKEAGKDRYAVFETSMHTVAEDRLNLELDLRAAIDEQQFQLVYQPTFDLQTKSVNGVEALIRWRHPTRGVLPPDEFIPLAEETGLIVPIGRWVVGEACAQAAAWRKRGWPIRVSVNVSSRQLEDARFLDDVRAELAETGLEPSALSFEITETTLMSDAEETARRLGELKRLGVRIAVDDFGTGYSSLGHLRQFPVDVLKIDRSFVRQLAEGGEGEILLHTLLQLGKALEIETTAEGIERPQDLSLIREKDCDNGQGFLFTRPLSAQDAGSFFRQWPPHRRFEVRHELGGDDRVPVDGSLGPDAAAAGADAR